MARITAVLAATVAFFSSLSGALADAAPEGKPWRTGDLVPVTCLNRTMYVYIGGLSGMWLILN
jgi:hypothetical protein